MPNQQKEIELQLKDSMTRVLQHVGLELQAVKQKADEFGVAAGTGLNAALGQTNKLSEASVKNSKMFASMGDTLTTLGKELVAPVGLAAGFVAAVKAVEDLALSSLQLRNFSINTGLAVQQISDLTQSGLYAGKSMGASADIAAALGADFQDLLVNQTHGKIYGGLVEMGRVDLANAQRAAAEAGNAQKFQKDFFEAYQKEGPEGKARLLEIYGVERDALEDAIKYTGQGLKRFHQDMKEAQDIQNRWVNASIELGNISTKVYEKVGLGVVHIAERLNELRQLQPPSWSSITNQMKSDAQEIVDAYANAFLAGIRGWSQSQSSMYTLSTYAEGYGHPQVMPEPPTLMPGAYPGVYRSSMFTSGSYAGGRYGYEAPPSPLPASPVMSVSSSPLSALSAGRLLPGAYPGVYRSSMFSADSYANFNYGYAAPGVSNNFLRRNSSSRSSYTGSTYQGGYGQFSQGSMFASSSYAGGGYAQPQQPGLISRLWSNVTKSVDSSNKKLVEIHESLIRMSMPTTSAGRFAPTTTHAAPAGYPHGQARRGILEGKRPAGGDSSGTVFTGPSGPPGTYRPQYPISDADISDEVVNTIAGEAYTNNQGSVDAVIHNMMNRVGSKGWGPSGNLKEVARAPGQYTGYRRASPEEAERIRARIKVIASGSEADPTNGSNQYRASSVGSGGSNRWNQGRPTVTVGGNTFAYDPSVPNGPYGPYRRKEEAGGGVAPTGPAGVGSDPNQKDRPFYMGGTFTMAGTKEVFHWGSGGSGRGSIPLGDYPVTPGTVGPWGSAHGAIGINNNAIYDPKLGVMREGIEIHTGASSDLDHLYTRGCFKVPPQEWPAFKAHLLAEIAKNGPMYLHVTREGTSFTHDKSLLPPEGTAKEVNKGASGGTFLFIPGMYSRGTPEQIAEAETAARRTAAAKGLKFEKIDISGDKPASQLAAARTRIKQGGVAEVFGFSAGAYTADLLEKEFKGIAYTKIGAPGVSGDIEFPKKSHWEQPGAYAEKAEADRRNIDASLGKRPDAAPKVKAKVEFLNIPVGASIKTKADAVGDVIANLEVTKSKAAAPRPLLDAFPGAGTQ